MAKSMLYKFGAGFASLTLAASMVPVAAGSAFAAGSETYWEVPTQATSVDYTKVLKTYGVRAGSAGPDYLGISNTNFDFTPHGTKAGQYEPTADYLKGVGGAGFAIWSTSVNESPNPFYANLAYNTITTGEKSATAATAWGKNPEESSWGDSSAQASTSVDGKATINGLEYYPDIIFGANKSTGWQNFDASSTEIGKAVAAGITTAEGTAYDPTFANNDSTNMWTQIYTLNNLALTAQDIKANTGQTTRYDSNDATVGALAYEKSLRGNLLYCASQIDSGKQEKKTVAYLYAIDDNGTAYFFTPTADGLLSDNDTGKTGSSAAATADSNYAGNNGTIDLDYHGVLPYITNTFDSGHELEGGIVMKVEDIYKTNPACTVSSADVSALENVDVIIYNTTKNTDLQGTSGGKNESNVNNAAALTDDSVAKWASEHGYTGSQVIAGDDYGTSSNQNYGNKDTTASGMSPLLYCQRNYTTDKNARAAWAFSKVYPELYPNEDASYSYWVSNVYHVKTDQVGKVAAYMTNQSDTVEYTEATEASMEQLFQIGYDWWTGTGSSEDAWSNYAYYNGSSRASYYDGDAKSEEKTNVIGIFQPSALWTANYEHTTVYRMYNPITSEHLYTTNSYEYQMLVAHDWQQEQVAWTSPTEGSVGVYRLYNPALGALGKMSHHYTTDKAEVENLVNNYGWVPDNGGEPIFYSAEGLEGAEPVFRLYNDGLSAHHYTLDSAEKDNLVANWGWNDEKIGFYALANVE